MFAPRQGIHLVAAARLQVTLVVAVDAAVAFCAGRVLAPPDASGGWPDIDRATMTRNPNLKLDRASYPCQQPSIDT
jgi:hypothetical protein